MASYLVVRIEGSNLDDANVNRLIEQVAEFTDLPVEVMEMETEYGRQHRGMGAEVLPVGTTKPNPRSETFKRIVGPWFTIGPEEWKDL